MKTVTANELKTRGIQAVEAALADADEVIVSVRGQDRYVVMDLDHYNRLREAELSLAIAESRADYEAGNFHTGSPEEHIARLERGE